MPPPSKRKQQEVRDPQLEPDLLMDGYGESEIGEGEVEVDNHRKTGIMATGREAVIKLERDSQLDRRAKGRIPNKNKSFRHGQSLGTGRGRGRANLLRSTSNVRPQSAQSTFSTSGSCFLCRRRADCNMTENPHRLHLMQVNMFKDTVQDILGNSSSLSPSSDTCAECHEVVEKVWKLQQEILLIKEELKSIIEKTVRNGRSIEEQHSDNDFSASDNGDDDGNDLFAVGGEEQSLDEIVKEEPIYCDFEADLDCYEEVEGVSSFMIQGEADNKKKPEETLSRGKRKSRIKAEARLRNARKNEDSQIESDDDKGSVVGVEEEEEQYSGDSESEFEYNRSKPKPTSSRSSSSSAAKDFRCDICHAMFKTPGTRRRHIQRVHEKRRHVPCTLCEKRFFRSDELTNHVLIYHRESAAKDFRCDICHAMFKTSGTRRRHIQRVHEKRRHVPCTLCDKRFFRSDELTNHVFMYHREAFEKQQSLVYSCEIEGCLRKFSRKKDFDRHVSAHDGQNSFMCSKCGTSFTQISGLKKHETAVDCTRDGYKAAVHKQTRLKRKHACSLCPLKCMTIEGLAHHQKTVHDIDPPPGVEMVRERTATCDICGVTLDKVHLKRHIERVHKNIKNKSCPYCDKMFYNTSDLNVHLRNHHPEADLIAQAESFLREDDDVPP